MSDKSEGPEWWQASDGKWYPPESHPSAQQSEGYSTQPPPQDAPPPSQVSPPQEDVKSGFLKGLGWGTGCLVVVILAVVVGVGGCIALIASGSDSEPDVVSNSGPSTTEGDKADSESEDPETSEAPAGPKDSPFVFLQGTVVVPDGEAGELAVVYVGKPEGELGSTVPILLRNNTEKPLGSIEVTGTARGADGALVGSGSSQGFQPEVLQPGEWGFGYIYFDSELPVDAAIETTARGDSPDDALFPPIQLTVSELNFQQGQYGGNYIGIVTNSESEEPASGPGVDIACFDAESRLVDVFSGYVDGEVAPGGTGSFSVDVFDSPACAAVAVASSSHGL